MPATPAWPPKSLPRLFVRQPLGDGATIELDAGQANYLGNVLRLGVGAELLVVRRHVGRMAGADRRGRQEAMTLTVERKTREPESVPDVWLAFAPVKRAQTDWLVEKATELGAARLIPVMTQRTIAERVKLERLEAIAIEAAEQCGRTRAAARSPSRMSLERVARNARLGRTLYFADESRRRGGRRAPSSPARR